MLSKPVQIRVLWEFGSQPQILRLEHQAGSRRVEEHFARIGPRYGERERTFHITKLQGWMLSLIARAIRAWKDGFRYLVNIVLGILDSDVKSRV